MTIKTVSGGGDHYVVYDEMPRSEMATFSRKLAEERHPPRLNNKNLIRKRGRFIGALLLVLSVGLFSNNISNQESLQKVLASTHTTQPRVSDVNAYDPLPECIFNYTEAELRKDLFESPQQKQERFTFVTSFPDSWNGDAVILDDITTPAQNDLLISEPIFHPNPYKSLNAANNSTIKLVSRELKVQQLPLLATCKPLSIELKLPSPEVFPLVDYMKFVLEYGMWQPNPPTINIGPSIDA